MVLSVTTPALSLKRAICRVGSLVWGDKSITSSWGNGVLLIHITEFSSFNLKSHRLCFMLRQIFAYIESRSHVPSRCFGSQFSQLLTGVEIQNSWRALFSLYLIDKQLFEISDKSPSYHHMGYQRLKQDLLHAKQITHLSLSYNFYYISLNMVLKCF